MLPPFRPLLSHARYLGAYGGRGGAKSHFFAEKLVQRCVDTPGTRAVCIREVQRSLEQSVKRLLEDKIRALGHAGKFRILTTHIETPGDGVIIFQGMQDHTAESLKSLEGYDIAWVEEAQALSENSLRLLRPTIRKEGAELWFSWNPRDPTDPVDALFRGDGGPPPDSIIVESSWRDNPYLPAAMRREIEWDRARNPDGYTHVWGGGYRKRSEASVFKNWRIEDLGEMPAGVFRLYGGDWGFAADPTVLVSCWFHPTLPRTLVIDYEAWEVGCEIEDTPDLWDGLFCAGACPQRKADCQRLAHGLARRAKVTGDSARPETISHMKRHGYPQLEPSKKGPGSVEEGVKFLQGYDIVVHPRCVHVVEELSSYSYKVDPKTGKILPVIADKKNHTIDSVRYAVESTRQFEERTRVRALW